MVCYKLKSANVALLKKTDVVLYSLCHHLLSPGGGEVARLAPCAEVK
jgi:hypothetical protein